MGVELAEFGGLFPFVDVPAVGAEAVAPPAELSAAFGVQAAVTALAVITATAPVIPIKWRARERLMEALYSDLGTIDPIKKTFLAQLPPHEARVVCLVALLLDL